MTTIMTRSYEPGFPAEWEGLCFPSADESTPRWYGVSVGNGNDGVSQLYPKYYVKTDDPFTLAAAAMLGEFKDSWKEWASEVMEIDGEADYTISATILDPPEVERDHEEPEEDSDEDSEDPQGDSWDSPEDSSWSSVNGAWIIMEVFRVDGPEDRAPSYDDLDECFSASVLDMARTQ